MTCVECHEALALPGDIHCMPCRMGLGLGSLDEARAVLREHGFSDYPTQWIEETAKLCPTEGAYADYGGWLAWLRGPVADQYGDDFAERLTEMEEPDISLLYAVFVDATRGTVEAMLEREVRDLRAVISGLERGLEEALRKP